MISKDRILSLTAIAVSIAAITTSVAANVTPGAQGPKGDNGVQGLQGPVGPAPNRTGIYAVATCANATSPGMVEYSVDVFIVNFGEARQFSYRVRYFHGDGATKADEVEYGASIAGWSVDRMTVHRNIVTESGCSFPHILWEGYTKIVRWS